MDLLSSFFETNWALLLLAAALMIMIQVTVHLSRKVKALLLVVILLVALLTVIEKPANPFFPCGRSGYVLGVFTEPAYRGQGLATQIMAQILAEAKRLALDTVTLSASDMGKGIYEKLGFTVRHSKFTEMEWFPE
jgi:GNAT superfamily N-acetyltransferase